MVQFRVVLAVVVVGMWSVGAVVGDGSLSQECTGDIQKLMGCLNFATGKGNTPSKECCTSVKDIKESEPKCLCYIMQQTHNGSNAIKSLGIQEAKLLQLPSACQLQNASVSYCPKILGLPPGSPDAAIFTNVTSTTVTPTTSSGSSSPDTADGEKRGAAGGLVILAVVVAVHAFAFV